MRCRLVTDGTQLPLHRDAVEFAQRQRQQAVDASPQHLPHRLECALAFLFTAAEGSRVGHAAVSIDRQAALDRANLIGRFVADRDHDIDLRGVGLVKLAPALAAQRFR